MVTIKSKREIELMREAGRVTALTHKAIEDAIKPGMTTADIDRIAEETMKKYGAVSAEKGYDPGIRGVPPYPAATCISINDEVIHGVPSSKRVIKDGDIVSVDLVALKNGYNGDAARTFLVGNVSKEARRLVEVTKQAFFEGIKYAKKGNRIGDVSHAIGEYVKSQGYSVVREFEGHGIGKEMHEEPPVPNYGKRGSGTLLKSGMCIAIEPMITLGSPRIYMEPDRWTIRTCDGKWAAHFEHTIAVRKGKAEVLSTFDFIEEVLGDNAI